MSFSFARGSASRKVCIGGLAETPGALMRPVLIVFEEPSIEIGLQLVDRPIDPFSERDPIEFIEHGAMKALADAVIRHDDFGTLMSAATARKWVMVSPSGTTGRREHKGAGRPPTDPGLRARARYMAAPCD